MAINGQAIVDYLMQYVGTPYIWGGGDKNGPTLGGFDCSGLMVAGFHHFGIDLPRVTYDQVGQGKAVSMKGLRPGDLVFFETDGKVPGPDHVGIYAGNGKMLHAPRPGKGVELVDLIGNRWYMDRFMGGRRIDGVHAVGGSLDDYAADTDVKLSPEELAVSYGWSVGFLNSNPELKKKFSQAVDEDWTTDKFQAEIRDTEWWKTTSESRRQAQLLKSTDPSTYNANLDAMTIKVKQMAAEIGAPIPQSKIRKIASDAIQTGMDDSQLQYALGEYINFFKDGTLKGEAGAHAYAMKQYAADMGITLSDNTLKKQAARIAKKVATVEDFESLVREQAKSAYPGYAAQIDGGVSMKDVAAPYMQEMAQTLELPDTSITLDDPQIKSALNGLSADGKPTGLSVSEFQDRLRSDPRWKRTSGAQNKTVAVGAQVLKDMGLIGG